MANSQVPKEKTYSDSAKTVPRRTPATNIAEENRPKIKPAPTLRSTKPLQGAARIKLKIFFVGGLATTTTAEDILENCRLQDVNAVRCPMLRSKRFGTQAARLTLAIAESDAEKIMSVNFWPNLVSVRDRIFPDE